MPIELKICGITSEKIINTIIQAGGCKYLGFIFYPPSPRNLSIEQSKKLTSIVPNYIKKVAVMVKPENSFVEKIKDQFDYLQLYDSSPAKVKELKLVSNKKINQSVNGNTKTVYINPLNSLRFVLNKVKKDKINLNKNFLVFTGSTVGVVPIKSKGLYMGKIDKLGSAKAVIN